MNKKLKDGAKCEVIGGTHTGKSGIMRDINTSKTGAVTITVVQASGVRFKTLAKNIEIISPKRKVLPKKSEMIKGYLVKYHANGKTIWSKGKLKNSKPEGYWQWFRPDGTLKRSGTFKSGVVRGEWTTYDSKGKVYKVTQKG